MSIESVFYSILSPVFETELYPVVHPDPDGTNSEVAELYAVFFKVGGQTFGTLEGDADIRRPRMQISIYGVNFDDVVAKEEAVIAAMKTANTVASAAVEAGDDPLTETGSLPNRIIGVSIDGYEKDTKRFVKTLEYYVWSNN